MKHIWNNHWFYFLDGTVVGANLLAAVVTVIAGNLVASGFHILLVGIFIYSAYSRDTTKETDETR